jgi:hypothetical protein
MKRYIALMFFIGIGNLVLAQSGTTEVPDYCESSSDYKKAAKEMLKPDFSYDASKTTKITYKNKPQLKELEIPLYMGEKYRFVFNTEGLPQSIDINIYNKKLEAKNRQLIWSSRNQSGDEHILIFEPEKSRKMYINYVIPPTTDEEKKGCIVFVLGYKIKGIEKD